MGGLNAAAACLACVALLFAGACASPASAEEPSAKDVAADGLSLTLEFIDTAIAQGRVQAAAELLSRARLQHRSSRLELRAAELDLAIAQYAKAERAFIALQSDPEVRPQALVGQAIALIRQKRDSEAKTLLEQALEVYPEQLRGWIALAALADRHSDWGTSHKAYAQAFSLAGGQGKLDATLWNNRGYSYMLQGRHALAEQDFHQARSLDPTLNAATNNWRLNRALQGRYTEAFEDTTRETLADDLNIVGYGAMLRGDYVVAEAYFARAIEQSSRHHAAAHANLETLAKLKKMENPALGISPQAASD